MVWWFQLRAAASDDSDGIARPAGGARCPAMGCATPRHAPAKPWGAAWSQHRWWKGKEVVDKYA
jgi:hypothetical protein